MTKRRYEFNEFLELLNPENMLSRNKQKVGTWLARLDDLEEKIEKGVLIEQVKLPRCDNGHNCHECGFYATDWRCPNCKNYFCLHHMGAESNEMCKDCCPQCEICGHGHADEDNSDLRRCGSCKFDICEGCDNSLFADDNPKICSHCLSNASTEPEDTTSIQTIVKKKE